jgi:beta-glucanase (GH16 family)
LNLPLLASFVLVALTACGGAPLDVVTPAVDDAALAIGDTRFLNGRPWRLVWHDEFEGDDIDLTKWQFDVTRPGAGAANRELQYYTDNRRENARLESGQLVIEARQDNFEGVEYSSARLKTLHRASWTYGRIEARVQVPSGRGTWAAFWMYADDMRRAWPGAGELDILEHVGMEPNHITQIAHSTKYNWMNHNAPGAVTTLQDPHLQFHVYSIEWFPDHIDWYIDSQLTATGVNDESGEEGWPYAKAFHILLNLAVGGAWGGQQGIDPDIWPRRMRVDWVRVWQL